MLTKIKYYLGVGFLATLGFLGILLGLKNRKIAELSLKIKKDEMEKDLEDARAAVSAHKAAVSAKEQAARDAELNYRHASKLYQASKDAGKVGLLAGLVLLGACSNHDPAPLSQNCTASGNTITCPDGSTLVVSGGNQGPVGPQGGQGPMGPAGASVSVTLISFPLVTTCNQLNSTTWAKRTAGTDIALYALATCTGASSQSLTHTGNEIFWSGPRQFYIMDTLTTMQRIDF